MYIEELVEVAIGLVMAWLVLSAATSHIQEVIVGWLGLRADGLEDMIESLIKGDRKRVGAFGRFWEQIIRRERFSKLLTWIPRIINWLGTISKKNNIPLLRHIKDDIRLNMEKRSEIVDRFYHHPIIEGLSLGRQGKPSYISAENFATALFDIIRTAGTDESVIQKTIDNLDVTIETRVADLLVRAGNELADVVLLAKATNENNNPTNQEAFEKALQALEKAYPMLEDVGTILKSQSVTDLADTAEEILENETFKKLLGQNIADLLLTNLNSLKNFKGVELWKEMDDFQSKYGEILLLDEKDKLTLEELQKDVACLVVSHPHLARSLYAIINQVRTNVTDVEDQLATVRSEVERWFNSSMDRAGGWYKRNRQWGAFAIALFLAFIFNVDSIALGQQLWYEPALRQAIAAQAEGETAETGNSQTDFEGFYTKLQDFGYPVGWRIESVSASSGLTCDLSGNANMFGILWLEKCYQPGTQSNGNFVVNIVGWLITALAAMQGAPFWFDLLQKLLGVRGAGKKPDSEEKLGSTSEPAALVISVKNPADEKTVDEKTPA